MLCVKASRKHVDEIEPRFCLHPKSTNTLVISASDFCKTKNVAKKRKRKSILQKGRGRGNANKKSGVGTHLV